MIPYLLPTPPARPLLISSMMYGPHVWELRIWEGLRINPTRDPGHVDRTAGVIAWKLCRLRERVAASAAPEVDTRALGATVVFVTGADDAAEVRQHHGHVVGRGPPLGLGPDVFLSCRAVPLGQLGFHVVLELGERVLERPVGRDEVLLAALHAPEDNPCAAVATHIRVLPSLLVRSLLVVDQAGDPVDRGLLLFFGALVVDLGLHELAVHLFHIDLGLVRHDSPPCNFDVIDKAPISL